MSQNFIYVVDIGVKRGFYRGEGAYFKGIKFL
jgi:hypothetical protein